MGVWACQHVFEIILKLFWGSGFDSGFEFVEEVVGCGFFVEALKLVEFFADFEGFAEVLLL